MIIIIIIIIIIHYQLYHLFSAFTINLLFLHIYSVRHNTSVLLLRCFVGFCYNNNNSNFILTSVSALMSICSSFTKYSTISK